MRADFIKAMTASTKELAKATEDKTEVDFIVVHKLKFVRDHELDFFWSTLKTLPTRDGNTFVAALGLGNLFVEKASRQDVLSSSYKFPGSKLYKSFKRKLRQTSVCTCVFVVGKSALVVSNYFNLKSCSKVHQELPEEGIQWAPIEELEALTFY